jgi:hypothetical protein
MPVLSVNGATIDYEDTGGDRPAVVLIHGWLGAWDHTFGPEIAWLRPHCRVLALSRRGYGRSGPKPRTYSRDFYRRDAEDVAAWLDAHPVTGRPARALLRMLDGLGQGRDMLMELAPEGHCHDLDTPTDAHRRLARGKGQASHLQLEDIAEGVDQPEFWRGLFPHVAGVDIFAARQEQAIDQIEVALPGRRLHRRRQQNDIGPCPLNGLEVFARDVSTQPHLLVTECGIGIGDADEGKTSGRHGAAPPSFEGTSSRRAAGHHAPAEPNEPSEEARPARQRLGRTLYRIPPRPGNWAGGGPAAGRGSPHPAPREQLPGAAFRPASCPCGPGRARRAARPPAR